MCEHEVAEQCSSFGGTRSLLSDDGKTRLTTCPAISEYSEYAADAASCDKVLNIADAFIGPIVWDDDGPMPTLARRLRWPRRRASAPIVALDCATARFPPSAHFHVLETCLSIGMPSLGTSSHTVQVLRYSRAESTKISPSAFNSAVSTYSSAVPRLYGVRPHTTDGIPARR